MKLFFPKFNDKGMAAARRKALHEKLDQMQKGDLTRTVLHSIVADVLGAFPPLAVGQSQVDGVTRRADVFAIPADGHGKSLLFDVTGKHCTAKADIKAQIKSHIRLLEKNVSAFNSNHHLAADNQDFPAVASAVRTKNKLYDLIPKLANIQARFGTLPRLKFVPAVVTHRCEMSRDLLDSIEYCTGRYKASLRISPHIDGLTPSVAGSRFRAQFKNDISVQMVSGFGKQLLATVSMSFAASFSSVC